MATAKTKHAQVIQMPHHKAVSQKGNLLAAQTSAKNEKETFSDILFK